MTPEYVYKYIQRRIHSQQMRRKGRRQSLNSQAALCTVCSRILPLTFYSCREEILNRKCSPNTDHNTEFPVCLTCEKLPSESNNSVPSKSKKSPLIFGSNANSFACSVCKKSFSQKSRLKDHEQFHTAEKPFSCHVCGKSFRLESYLQLHSSVHTGEKRYQCKQCGKKFRIGQSLTIHTRIHTGEKPYDCEVCGKQFRQLASLYTHRKVHKKWATKNKC